jgi:dipeptidyl aminopeptidase/acylaminoacyl peptidase
MDTEAYLDSLLSLPAIYSPLVSRDCRWIAWTWFRMGPAADVFVAPTDASRSPIRLTETLENTYVVSWLPDNSAVVVAQDTGGNERDQLFRVELNKPMVMQPLTEANPNYFIRGGEMHPNNQYLLYGANYDIHQGIEIEPTWIYRHNLATGERKVLAKPQKGGYVTPSFSSDGHFVIYPRQDLHPAGQQIWLVDVDGNEDREILNFGHNVKTFASWIPSTHRVLFLVETQTHRKLGILDIQNDHIEWLIDDPHRNIEQATIPYGSDKVILIDVQDAGLHASLLDPKTLEETAISLGDGNLEPLAPFSTEEWIGAFYSSTQPADLCRFSIPHPEDNNLTSISRTWEQTTLTKHDFTPAKSYHWHSEDGLEIQGFLYLPDCPPKGTVIYIHGGPTAHSRDAINTQIQLFARNGYVVLAPNYRGSTGFGMAYQEAIKEQGWGGMEQIDIRTGIECLMNDGMAQPGKIAITGTSYGGYSAWWAITHFPTHIVSTAAPICGMTDLVVDYESTRPDLRPYSEEMMGGTPNEIPQKYADRSPINFIQNIKGHLLIIQGERDPNVTPQNVEAVRKVLDKASIPYEILTFADEGHGISKPKNQKILYLALIDFFNRVME